MIRTKQQAMQFDPDKATDVLHQGAFVIEIITSILSLSIELLPKGASR